MSGIVGLYRINGAPAQAADLQAMNATLAHRGPDGAGIWIDGSVGFGHRLLQTTPESCLEQQPLVTTRPPLLLTADARLDNRDELIASLDLKGCRQATLTDADLILTAYVKWGTRCPEYLLGAFAFVIWDVAQATVLGARDHLGVKPFVYYHRPGHLFAFGSEIKAILAVPDVPRRLNELRVGYHLAGVYDDPTITFYQDIVRLRAGHRMTVRPQGLCVQAYWSLDATRELRLSSDADYASAFAEQFTEAVHCRVRSARPVGCALSGGLDSSSVALVAQPLLAQRGQPRLPTFSGIYDDLPECDERPFINAVLSQGGFEPHSIRFDQLRLLGDVEAVFGSEDEPHPSLTWHFIRALYHTAHTEGVRILLDGVDGDTTVCHGYGRLAELAAGQQWTTFGTEARAIATQEGLPNVATMLGRYGTPSLMRLARRGHWGTYAQAVRALSGPLALSPSHLVLNYLLKPMLSAPVRRLRSRWRGVMGPTPGSVPGWVNPGFAQRVGLRDQIETVSGWRSRRPQSAREEHQGSLESGLIPYVFEGMDRAAAAFSVEARHPFTDKRLVEFCLSLPAEQKLRQGWTRWIMRQGLASRLPEPIQRRGGKTLNSAAVSRSLQQMDRPRITALMQSDLSHLSDYVDVKALQQGVGQYLSRSAPGTELVVWQAVTLALWLQHTKLTP